MTEQEAQAWAERLIRIWKPKTFELREESSTVFFYFAEVGWDALFSTKMMLYAYKGKGFPYRWRFQLSCSDAPYNDYDLVWDEEHGCQSVVDDITELVDWEEIDRAFSERWMPFFRRGCWLSGCPLEASADEKAEWIQGFTSEELEAWNLKI
jgi:hypothetical protein